MSVGYYEFKVSADGEGAALKTFLRQKCGLSARSMTVIKYHGGSISDGTRELKAHDILHKGDVVSVTLPQEVIGITPVTGKADILYEDDYLLIVNKPADMPVHPTKVHQLDTLANIIAYHQQNRGESYTFRVLNRLDKDTSGCVIIAKDRIAYSLIQPTVHKIYAAVCEGKIEASGTVDMPIALEENSVIKRCTRADGAKAVTHYRPLLHRNGHTLCELWLETGRTHQIRCHMSSIGHPLAGDDLYGGSLRSISRQALHCRSVSLIHPVTHEEIAVNTDLPAEMTTLIEDK